MNKPAEPPKSRPSLFDAEAIVGAGISIATLGVMFLLLGWAQVMREAEAAAWILLPIGGVLLVAGVITAMAGRSRKGSGPVAREAHPADEAAPKEL